MFEWSMDNLLRKNLCLNCRVEILDAYALSKSPFHKLTD